MYSPKDETDVHFGAARYLVGGVVLRPLSAGNVLVHEVEHLPRDGTWQKLSPRHRLRELYPLIPTVVPVSIMAKLLFPAAVLTALIQYTFEVRQRDLLLDGVCCVVLAIRHYTVG